MMANKDRDGRTELHQAAFSDDVEKAREMLDRGADPNEVDKDGFTPLHLAAQEYSLGVARMLLERGAHVDAVNKFGNTPLFTAVFNSRGRGDMIDILRQKGADPKKPNKSGQTPLGLARLIGNYDVRRFFSDLPGGQTKSG